jgi:hypothetical protein
LVGLEVTVWQARNQRRVRCFRRVVPSSHGVARSRQLSGSRRRLPSPAWLTPCACRSVCQMADAAIEEQLEVQTAFREHGARLQKIYDTRQRTEMEMAKREQEMKQLQGEGWGCGFLGLGFPNSWFAGLLGFPGVGLLGWGF